MQELFWLVGSNREECRVEPFAEEVYTAFRTQLDLLLGF
jgi:hypothetical protein